VVRRRALHRKRQWMDDRSSEQLAEKLSRHEEWTALLVYYI
jgi:hypothetical protein